MRNLSTRKEKFFAAASTQQTSIKINLYCFGNVVKNMDLTWWKLKRGQVRNNIGSRLNVFCGWRNPLRHRMGKGTQIINYAIVIVSQWVYTLSLFVVLYSSQRVSTKHKTRLRYISGEKREAWKNHFHFSREHSVYVGCNKNKINWL